MADQPLQDYYVIVRLDQLPPKMAQERKLYWTGTTWEQELYLSESYNSYEEAFRDLRTFCKGSEDYRIDRMCSII